MRVESNCFVVSEKNFNITYHKRGTPLNNILLESSIPQSVNTGRFKEQSFTEVDMLCVLVKEQNFISKINNSNLHIPSSHDL